MGCVVTLLMDHGGSTCLGKESVTPGSPNTLRTTAGVDCVRLLAPWRGNERHSFRGVRLCICPARVAEQRRGPYRVLHFAILAVPLAADFMKCALKLFVNLRQQPCGFRQVCPRVGRAGTRLPRVRGHRLVRRHKRPLPHRGRGEMAMACDGRPRGPGRASLRVCAE